MLFEFRIQRAGYAPQFLIRDYWLNFDDFAMLWA